MTWRIPLAALAATLVAGTVALAQPAVQQPSPPRPAVQQPSPPLAVQQPSPQQPPPVSVPPLRSGASVDEAVNLRVEVVISRYRGDEQVSRLPYVLTFTSGGDRSSLSVDADVPLRESRMSHRSVGTRISAFARGAGEGRYAVTVDVEESSILDDGETSMEAIMLPGAAVFDSFTSFNTLVLRDGQSHRYAAAADRVTGETVRVDVTLTVLDQESAP